MSARRLTIATTLLLLTSACAHAPSPAPTVAAAAPTTHPDRQIVLVEQLKEKSRLYTLDLQNHTTTELTVIENARIGPPCSARTSDTLAYAVNRKGHSRMEIRGSSGSKVIRESTTETYLTCAFLADGVSLILAKLEGDKSVQLVMISPPYKEEKSLRLTQGKDVITADPAISADGKTLAFTSDSSGKPIINIISLESVISLGETGSAAQTNESTGKPLAFSGGYSANPAFSPTEARVAFSAYDGKTKNLDIFISDYDGNNLRRLTSFATRGHRPSNNERPQFSWDGSTIYFLTDRHGSRQVNSVSLETGKVHPVTDGSSPLTAFTLL